MRYEDGTLFIKVPNNEILGKIDRVIIEADVWYKEFVQYDEEGKSEGERKTDE